MRLSDIKGDRVIDVIADLIDPICNIAQTDAGKALFHMSSHDRMDPNAAAMKRLRKHAPALLRDSKRDIIAILSVLGGITAEEYERDLTIVSLMRDITDLLTDEAFVELFISAQQEPTTSGAAQETTEGA